MSDTPSTTESSSAQGSRRGLKVLAPFRVRDFALYWTARTVSFLGDGVMYVALPWQVYELVNSPKAMGVVGALETGAILAFVLFGGVASDRFERKRVIIVSDLVRALAAGVVGVLAISGDLQLWHVAAMSVVFGLGQAFAGPAFGSIVPQLVPDDLLVPANSALFTVNPLAMRFIGPALGGFVIAAFGTGAAFLVDAASFAAGAIAIAFVAARPAARLLEEGDQRTVFEDIRESIRYVRAHVWLWGTLLWALLVLPLAWGPYAVLVPYLVKNELGGDAQDLGLVFAAGGISSVLMALVVSQVGVPRRHIAFMYAMFGLGAVDLAIYAATQTPWQAMLVAFVTECGWTGGLVVWNTLVQKAVPSELLGRVRSVDWIASIGLVPLSFAVVGPIADVVGVRPVMVACGVGGVLLSLAAFLLPGMRDTESQISLSGP
ncbi:MAG TPA: MFS transporter [Gaiellaceae bacterium]|nr:MFS transporter [Gaiellaceae bacterium]